jgi:5'-3' exoribonuclease 1
MYHFLTERYPQIVDEVSTQAILPFCDVYLHLNGYIETCVNRSKKYPHVSFDESLFLDLIQHIEHVLHILRPQKNLFLFLDGVIPCALHPNLLATRFLNEQVFISLFILL